MAAINRSEQYVTIHSQLRVTHVAENVTCVHIRCNHDLKFSSLTVMYISGSVKLLSLESVGIAVAVDVNYQMVPLNFTFM